jgi:hypothetical protein
MMKSIAVFLALAGYQCVFGQTDTNIVAVGDWSEPVSDPAGYTLRGRLLVYDAEYYSTAKMWGYARVYLELQHTQPRKGDSTVVYRLRSNGEIYPLMQTRT